MASKSIGIQFYGKLDLRRYFGVCPHCHKKGELASYETQRWFGILLVPILPLGRRLILDHCTSCGHLDALAPGTWLQKKQADVSRAAEAMKAAPDEPEPALHLHERLEAFGRTAEAAELLSILQRRFPSNQEVLDYAANVSRVATETVPAGKEGRPLLRFMVLSAVIAAALLAITNAYLARNQLIHVVNGLESPVTISLANGRTLTVPPQGNLPIQTEEGAGTAKVTGAVEEEISYRIDPGLTERWFNRHHYILNPGGAAVFISEATPPGSGQRDYQLHIGQQFLSVPAKDYLFSDFPAGLRSGGGPSKTRFDVVNTPPSQLFYSLVQERHFTNALSLAEWDLERNPDQADFLSAYINVGLVANASARVHSFLVNGTRRRPVRIQWHRIYQSLPQGAAAQGGLIAEYDQLLQSEPANSALLYLRGRLSGRIPEANPFYQKAIAADPGNAFAHHALGYNAASTADWAGARDHLKRACALRPDDEQMQELFYLSRLALGEFGELETELRAALDADPLLLTEVRRLSEVLLATGRAEEAKVLSTEHKALLARRFPAQAESIHAQLAAHIAYAQGDFLAMERILESDKTMQGRLTYFCSLVEQGRFDDATNTIPLVNVGEPLHMMLFAVAEDRAGRTDSAKAHRAIAEQRMSQGRPGYLGAVQLLRAAAAPSLNEVLEISLAPQSKAILLMALAHRFPDAQEEFTAASLKLNISREFPHHLIRRLAGAKKEA